MLGHNYFSKKSCFRNFLILKMYRMSIFLFLSMKTSNTPHTSRILTQSKIYFWLGGWPKKPWQKYELNRLSETPLLILLVSRQEKFWKKLKGTKKLIIWPAISNEFLENCTIFTNVQVPRVLTGPPMPEPLARIIWAWSHLRYVHCTVVKV